MTPLYILAVEYGPIGFGPKTELKVLINPDIDNANKIFIKLINELNNDH